MAGTVPTMPVVVHQRCRTSMNLQSATVQAMPGIVHQRYGKCRPLLSGNRAGSVRISTSGVRTVLGEAGEAQAMPGRASEVRKV